MVQAAWDFKSLRFLMLKDLPCCTRLPDGLRRLPTLESLHIEDAPAIKCVGPEFQSPSSLAVGGGIISATRFVPAFPNLTRINLEGFTEWEEWDWEEQGEDETGCCYVRDRNRRPEGVNGSRLKFLSKSIRRPISQKSPQALNLRYERIAMD